MIYTGFIININRIFHSIGIFSIILLVKFYQYHIIYLVLTTHTIPPAVLMIYLTEKLMMGNDEATNWYHEFVALCFATPLLGALIADVFIGKFLYVVSNKILVSKV